MAEAEYIPTTEDIRTAWTHGYHGDNYPDAMATDAEFDRWLAAHDAEVGRQDANNRDQ